MSAATARAEDAELQQLQRLVTADSVAVSQAIAWALQGPISPTERKGVEFAGGSMPAPIATGTMYTHNVVLFDYGTLQGQPTRRRLAGSIELSDSFDHRVVAQFEADYDVVSPDNYRVNGVAIREIYPVSPLIRAYFLPAGTAVLTGKSPYDMLDAIRRAAVDPATTDAAPRQYRVYVVGMDRLPPQADLSLVAVDGATGRELARSQSQRQNGWVVAALSARFAINGKSTVFFPVLYRPEGAGGAARVLLMFSSRNPDGAPALSGAAAGAGSPLPAEVALAPAPALSPLGQAFLAKGIASQLAQP